MNDQEFCTLDDETFQKRIDEEMRYDETVRQFEELCADMKLIPTYMKISDGSLMFSGWRTK